MASKEYSKYIELVAEYEDRTDSNRRVTEVLDEISTTFSELTETEQEIVNDIYWYVK